MHNGQDFDDLFNLSQSIQLSGRFNDQSAQMKHGPSLRSLKIPRSNSQLTPLVDGLLSQQTLRYPLIENNKSCMKLEFPECLFHSPKQYKSIFLQKDAVEETEYLEEYQGFLCTFLQTSNLYYVLPHPNHSVFDEFKYSYASMFPLFDPAPLHFKNLRAFISNGIALVFTLQYENNSQQSSKLVCLHDIFKLPRKNASFSRTIVFEQAGIIDYEVRILPYDNDNFSFLLGSTSVLTTLNYNAKKNQAVLRSRIQLDKLSLIYVMSLREVILKEEDAKHLNRFEFKKEYLNDLGVLPQSSELVDFSWKPSRQELVNSIIKGKRGRYLIMYCNRNDNENLIILLGSNHQKIGQVAVRKIYSNPELKHVQTEDAYLVYHANKTMIKFFKDQSKPISVHNLLLNESLSLQRLSIAENKNQVIKVGVTENDLYYVSIKQKKKEHSLLHIAQHQFVLKFSDIHQLHQIVNLHTFGINDIVELYFDGSKILLLHQSSTCLFYEAQMDDGRELVILINRDTHKFLKRQHDWRESRFQIFHDHDEKSPFPLALIRTRNAQQSPEQQKKPVRRSVTSRILSIHRANSLVECEDSSRLHLWTGGESVIPIRSAHNEFQSEGQMFSALSKLIFLLPSNLSNLTQLQDIEWLIVIQLLDPYCAVVLKPECNWRLIGNINLTKLLQHEQFYQRFYMLHFNEKEALIEVRFIEWNQSPRRQLTGVDTCQNLISIQDQYFLYVSGSYQLQSKEIQIHDTCIFFFHLLTQTVQSVRNIEHLEFLHIVSNSSGIPRIMVKTKAPLNMFFLTFAFPIQFDFMITVGQFQYEVKAGAKGILLLLEFSHDLPDELPTSIPEYVNHFLYFHSHKLQPRHTTYHSKSLADYYRSCFEELFDESENFYLRLKQCSVEMLLLMLLHSFQSLEEMNTKFGQHRFTASLADYLITNKASGYLFIFAKDLARLYKQADLSNIPLKPFFEASAIKVHQGLVDINNPRSCYETEDPSYEEFLKNKALSSHGHKFQLEIYRSRFKFPPSDHPETIQFSLGLFETQDREIFESPLIESFLEMRWKEARYFFLIEAIVLILSLSSLFAFSAIQRDIEILVPLVALQLWTLTIQVIEIRYERSRYFLDFWNWFDFLRFAFTIIYFVVDYTNSFSPESESQVLTFLNLFYAFKTFSIFALHKSTRVLLRGIIEIVRDSIPFLVLCMAATFLFALLYTSALPSHTLKSYTYYEQLFHVFKLNFGDFTVEHYNSVQIFIFVVAALFGPLMMLNTVIAIMSDTYDRVKEDQGRRDLQELAGLVYKYKIIERVLCARRKPGAWKYVYYSREVNQGSHEFGQTWQGRIKGIKQQILKMQEAIEHSIGRLEDQTLQIEKRQTEFIQNYTLKIQDEVIKSITSLKQEIGAGRNGLETRGEVSPGRRTVRDSFGTSPRREVEWEAKNIRAFKIN